MYDIFFGAKGAPRVATSALAKIKVGRTKRPTFILEQATRVRAFPMENHRLRNYKLLG